LIIPDGKNALRYSFIGMFPDLKLRKEKHYKHEYAVRRDFVLDQRKLYGIPMRMNTLTQNISMKINWWPVAV
jgi:hypothetical protein